MSYYIQGKRTNERKSSPFFFFFVYVRMQHDDDILLDQLAEDIHMRNMVKD